LKIDFVIFHCHLSCEVDALLEPIHKKIKNKTFIEMEMERSTIRFKRDELIVT
jgi:hypothetical protein